MKADRCSRPGRAIDSIIEVIKSNTTTAAWDGYSNSFFNAKGQVPQVGVLKLGPFLASPVHSGPFAWSRSPLFKEF